MLAREIPVYSAEKEAGLVDSIRAQANCTVAYTTQARAVDPAKVQVSQELLDKLKATAGKEKQTDLFYMDAILVSVGWNLNTDVFLKEEVWAARHTPDDKKVNYSHDEKDIIGHITATYPVNEELAQLDDNLMVDQLPDKFHLITSAVLYKVWDDETLDTRMNTIIERIAKGNIYVSMEALFYNFDYALKYPDGRQVVVARNEETAFLTKYLKAYGGAGVYKDIEVGRALRHIVFSGKGIVDEPANPKSIIFNDTVPFNGKAVSSFKDDGEKKTMADVIDNKLVEKLDKVSAALEAELAEKAANKTKAEAEAKAAVEKEFNELKTDVKAKATKIDELTAELSKANESFKGEKATLEAKIADLEKSAKAAQDELATIKAEAKKAHRIAKLVAAGHTNEKAVELETKFNGLADEAFAAVLEHVKVVAEKLDPKEDLKKGEPDGDPDLSKAGKETEDAEKAKAEKLVEEMAKTFKSTARKNK
jgi:hypothetical protein